MRTLEVRLADFDARLAATRRELRAAGFLVQPERGWTTAVSTASPKLAVARKRRDRRRTRPVFARQMARP